MHTGSLLRGFLAGLTLQVKRTGCFRFETQFKTPRSHSVEKRKKRKLRNHVREIWQPSNKRNTDYHDGVFPTFSDRTSTRYTVGR